MQVIVVGGGIVGTSCALELAARGVRVVMVERAAIGAGASSAAAGILGAQAESLTPHPWFARFLAAREQMRGWLPQVAELAKIDFGYRPWGTLRTASDADQLAECMQITDWQAKAGAKTEYLTAQDLRHIEPALDAGLLGGVLFADDAQVDPRALMRALGTLARREPLIEVREGESVATLLRAADRVSGVETASGRLCGDWTLLTAGAWSSELLREAGVGAQLVPIAGQIIEYADAPVQLSRTVVSGHRYLVPRGAGRVLCGATMEHQGFAAQTTAAGLAELHAAAARLLPELATTKAAHSWAGVRPQLAGGPLVECTRMPGLAVAIGHYRNGILLARWTALRIAELLTA